MSKRILVTPEHLEQVSAQFAQSGASGREMVDRLQRSIHEMEGQWQGMTRERFYGDYQQARSTMLQYVESLQKISTELKQISVKFRTADETVNGAVVGGLAAGSGILAGTGLAGGLGQGTGTKNNGHTTTATSNPAKPDSSDSLLNKAMEGVEVEGSVAGNGKNGLYANAFSGYASAGLMEGVEVGGSVVDAGYSNDYVNGSVSVFNAEVGASIKDGSLSVGAEATLTKYEAA